PARVGSVPALRIRTAEAPRGGGLHRDRTPAPRRGQRPARDGAGRAGGGGRLMVRATSALARPHPAGFVHAVAAAPVSSDPFRLLRASPPRRRSLGQQPAAGMAIGAVGPSASFRGRGARRFADLAAAVADVTDDEPLPPGVVAVGGFAFDANAREAGPWR